MIKKLAVEGVTVFPMQEAFGFVPGIYIYFGDESVGCGKGIEKLDRGTIERAFDVMIPDLLAIDGFYTLCRDSLDPIKALCSRAGVQLRGNERDELSIDLWSKSGSGSRRPPLRLCSG